MICLLYCLMGIYGVVRGCVFSNFDLVVSTSLICDVIARCAIGWTCFGSNILKLNQTNLINAIFRSNIILTIKTLK